MYIIENKPFEITVWNYALNGNYSQLFIDSSNYNKLSIAQHDNSSVIFKIYGVTDTNTEISINTEGYYDISEYNSIILQVSASISITGTISGLKLWY